MIFRNLRRYKIKRLYVCELKTLPIPDSFVSMYRKYRILYYNRGKFVDPLTSEFVAWKDLSNSKSTLIINDILGRLDYMYELPESIYLRGDYFTLADIIFYDEFVKNDIDNNSFSEVFPQNELDT